MKNYKYYYFDFDGTLGDSLPALVRPFQMAFATCGVNLDEDGVRELTHMAFVQMCEKFGIKDEDKVLALYKYLNEKMFDGEEIAKVTFFPEVRDVLTKLKKEGMRIAIVSGNHTDYIQKALQAHDLEKFFDFVVGGNSVAKPKPYADPLLKAIELSGNPAKEDCIYIGDSLQDVGCAKNAGIDGILLDRRHEYQAYQEKKIFDLEELVNGK